MHIYGKAYGEILWIAWWGGWRPVSRLGHRVTDLPKHVAISMCTVFEEEVDFRPLVLTPGYTGLFLAPTYGVM